jgi:hypothetical protein
MKDIIDWIHQNGFLFGQPFLSADWLKYEHEITWNVDTKNAESAYFCKEWKGLYCRNLGLILSYIDVLLYGFVDYKNKNN